MIVYFALTAIMLVYILICEYESRKWIAKLQKKENKKNKKDRRPYAIVDSTLPINDDISQETVPRKRNDD